ncbi:unnamed protein product, partial [Ceratitis capitata]
KIPSLNEERKRFFVAALRVFVRDCAKRCQIYRNRRLFRTHRRSCWTPREARLKV